MIRFCVDNLSFNGIDYIIEGWCFSELNHDVAIVATNSTITASRKNRPDVNQAFSSFNLSDELGFTLKAPKKIKSLQIKFSSQDEYILHIIEYADLKQVRDKYKQDKLDKLTNIISNANFKNLKKTYSYLMAYGIKTTINKISQYILQHDEIKIYNHWLLNSHIPDKDELDKQKNQVFDYMPLISIVTPTFNTPKSFLIEMIESVIAQSYQKWELCIADGASKNIDTIQILKTYQKKYPDKIKVIYLTENYHISGNTNEALKLIAGDYVSFFDHDDLLTPNCLYEYVFKINQDSKPALLYCDEDKTNEYTTSFFDPFFKSDFGLFTIRSRNDICHLMTIRRDILDKVGSLDSHCDGAQDHDMVLRVIDLECTVSHISKILYHWRVHSSSTAQSGGSKKYTNKAGKLALTKHLERNNIKGLVKDGFVDNLYKINYNIIGNPLVSIVIPNKDHIEDLRICIESIYDKSTYENFEVVIVENNSSTKEIFSYYKDLENKYKNIKIIYYSDVGFNYSKIMNLGGKNAAGEYLLLLNNDISIISSNWIEEMLMYAQLQNVGAVGAKLYYPDDTIQHCGVVLGVGSVAAHKNLLLNSSNPGYFSYAYLTHNVSAVTAACMMVPTKVYVEVGGLSEDLAVAFNDIDFCMKVRSLNYDVVINPSCELYHYESKSRGYEDTPAKIARFKKETNLFGKKWGLWLDDPYYNPNFTKLSANYQLKLYSEK